MIKVILLLVIGFIVLVKSSDIFVEAINSMATNLRMSKMMISLTVAAFGTCAPELAISFNGFLMGEGDIALANVLGSNVVNILLIIGISALVYPIKVKNSVTKKELPILLLLTTMFSLSMISNFLFDGTAILSRIDGVIFLLFFLVFILYIIAVIRMKEGAFERSKSKYKTPYAIILMILCPIMIILSSNIIVDNAKIIAEMCNVSTKLITMTVIVIGTSLPELTMTIISAKKNEYDIAIGNIIGTNIFNIGVVLGLPLVIFGGFNTNSFNLIDVCTVLIAAMALYYFSRNDKIISRKEGIIMILLFVAYYVYIFIQ